MENDDIAEMTPKEVEAFAGKWLHLSIDDIDSMSPVALNEIACELTTALGACATWRLGADAVAQAVRLLGAVHAHLPKARPPGAEPDSADGEPRPRRAGDPADLDTYGDHIFYVKAMVPGCAVIVVPDPGKPCSEPDRTVILLGRNGSPMKDWIRVNGFKDRGEAIAFAGRLADILHGSEGLFLPSRGMTGGGTA